MLPISFLLRSVVSKRLLTNQRSVWLYSLDFLNSSSQSRARSHSRTRNFYFGTLKLGFVIPGFTIGLKLVKMAVFTRQMLPAHDLLIFALAFNTLSATHKNEKFPISPKNFEEPEPLSQPGPSRGARQKRRRTVRKPEGILAYNKGKIGIDISDQMASYECCLRKGLKWYRKLSISILLGMALTNAWLIYKNATNKTLSIKTFKELICMAHLGLAVQLTAARRPPQDLQLPQLEEYMG